MQIPVTPEYRQQAPSEEAGQGWSLTPADNKARGNPVSFLPESGQWGVLGGGGGGRAEQGEQPGQSDYPNTALGIETQQSEPPRALPLLPPAHPSPR